MTRAVTKYLLFFSVVFSIIFLSCAIGECQNNVRVIGLKGSPEMMKTGSPDWAACSVGSGIENGDRIKTEKGEVVDIAFTNGVANIVRVDSESDVFIRSCSDPYRIELLNGATMAWLQKLPAKSTFEIKTPTGISGARGTGWRSWTNGQTSIFSVFQNFIYTMGLDGQGNPTAEELIVKDGWKAFIDKLEKSGRIEKLSKEDRAIWDAFIEELRKAFGISGNFDRANSLNSKIEELESKKQDIREARDLDGADRSSSRDSEPPREIDKGGDY